MSSSKWFLVFLCFQSLGIILTVFRTLDAARRTFMDAVGSRWISNGIYSSYTLFFRPLVPLTEVYDILIKFFLKQIYDFLVFYISLNLSLVCLFRKSLVSLLHYTKTLHFVFLTREPLIVP